MTSIVECWSLRVVTALTVSAVPILGQCNSGTLSLGVVHMDKAEVTP